jgi:hypothetical protein
MSVPYDHSRRRYVVRSFEGVKRQVRRFVDEAEAREFATRNDQERGQIGLGMPVRGRSWPPVLRTRSRSPEEVSDARAARRPDAARALPHACSPPGWAAEALTGERIRA